MIDNFGWFLVYIVSTVPVEFTVIGFLQVSFLVSFLNVSWYLSRYFQRMIDNFGWFLVYIVVTIPMGFSEKDFFTGGDCTEGGYCDRFSTGVTSLFPFYLFFSYSFSFHKSIFNFFFVGVFFP